MCVPVDWVEKSSNNAIFLMVIIMQSNLNGRALEYCLVNQLVLQLQELGIPVRLDKKTEYDQVRDVEKFYALEQNVKDYFISQCQKVSLWIIKQKFTNHTNISITRLSDDDAKNGDVTDIRLVSDVKEYNISLKHNHTAVKHQRPGGLYKQLGISDKSLEQSYKKSITLIEKRFFETVHAFNFSDATFKSVRELAPCVIDDLYSDICDLVIEHLSRNVNHADYLFSFLLGYKNFDKIVITKDSVSVMSFYDIKKPTLFQAGKRNNSYVILKFNNGFEFAMRLHTASSRYQIGKSLSLKFDTQLISDFPFILIE